MSTSVEYSIVIPCYRSAETIRQVVETTATEMRRMGRDSFEFVLVNDCSPDNRATAKAIFELAAEYPFVKAIDLAKNVGQHNASMAGLRNASGSTFISMDDDMQTRPSELPKMFEAYDAGYDVVYGCYPEKHESPFRLFGSWVNRMFAQWFLGKPKDLRSSSFWIMRGYVRDSIIGYTGSYSYLLGLILRATSNITSVEVRHFDRESGTSGYTFKTLLSLFSNMIGFTVKPLRLATYSGFGIALVSFVVIAFTVIRKLVNPTIDAGWTSIIASIYLALGLILMVLGVIGEYVGRSYLKVNDEPQYVIRQSANLDDAKGPNID